MAEAAEEARAPRLTTRPTAIGLGLLVVVGAVLRFWGLGASRLNYDESFTAMAGRLPIGSLFNLPPAPRLAPTARLPAARGPRPGGSQ